MSPPSLPPAHLVTRVAGDQTVQDFISSFEHVRYAVKHYLQAAGHEFGEFESILDFGCGVGRFLMAFEAELKLHQRLYGCDVYEECARWCQQHLPFATVEHTNIVPPLPFNDGQFDLVYALSVFTHLRLDLQFLWAREIYRVLRPGGVFFMTVHGPYFFPILHEVFVRGTTFLEIYRRRHSRVVEMYTLGDDGLFCYADYQGRNRQGQLDVGAAHSAGFVAELFRMFTMKKRFPQSMMAAGQDVYILQKPEAAPLLALPRDETGSASDQWEFPELVSGSTPTGIELRYALGGQGAFRVYPRLEPSGFYTVEAGVEVAGSGGLLERKSVQLNTARAWGGHHLGAVEVRTPAASGDVRVRLTSRLVSSHPIWEGQWPQVVWSFPYFV